MQNFEVVHGKGRHARMDRRSVRDPLRTRPGQCRCPAFSNPSVSGVTHKHKKPRRLRAGDRIAMVSPSWGGPSVFPAVCELGLKAIRDVLGLEPVELPTARMDAASLAKSPQAQALGSDYRALHDGAAARASRSGPPGRGRAIWSDRCSHRLARRCATHRPSVARALRHRSGDRLDGSTHLSD